MNLKNEDEDDGKWWLLSGSLESITAALQTVVTLTTTTRNLVSGCFPCWSNSNGCFKRKERSSDGAWFDCEQFQFDHPHCYENQVALELNRPFSTEDSGQNNVSRKYNGFLSTPNSALCFDQIPDSTLTQTGDNPNSNNVKHEKLNGIITPVTDRKQKKDTKYKKYKQSLMDTTSFASKLERDHFAHRSHDILRSEGEAFSPKFVRSKSERFHHRPSIRSPVVERRTLTSNNLDLPCQSLDWEEESLTSLEEESSMFFGDIWKPHELENAFEMYNSTTLKSFGFLNAEHQKKSVFKNNNDKFEDIFPTLLNTHERQSDQEPNNNDNLLGTSHKPDTKLKGSHGLEKPLVTQTSEKENDINKENELHCALTLENLKKLIHLCIFIDNVYEVDLRMSMLMDNELSCDKYLTYCGKSFKSKLIFNLVKEAKTEHVLQYSNSLSLFIEYPVNIIEKKVIAAIQFGENCSSYQRAILEDVEKVRQNMLMCNNLSEFAKVPEEILIENVTAEEIRKEGRLWQKVEKEENELKNNVSEEIFNELLSKEISVLENLFSKKLSAFL